MTDNQQPTICLKCRYRIAAPLEEDWSNDLCKVRPVLNYVRGGVIGYRRCYIQNDRGRCHLYAPIPVGSDPADMDELNAAVEAGEV